MKRRDFLQKMTGTIGTGTILIGSNVLAEGLSHETLAQTTLVAAQEIVNNPHKKAVENVIREYYFKLSDVTDINSKAEQTSVKQNIIAGKSPQEQISAMIERCKEVLANLEINETPTTGAIRGHGVFSHRNVRFEPEKQTQNKEIQAVYTRPGGDWIAQDKDGNFFSDPSSRAEYLQNLSAGIDTIETHGISGIIAIDKKGQCHAISPSLGPLFYQSSELPVTLGKEDEIRWVSGVTLVLKDMKISVVKTKDERPNSTIDQDLLDKEINTFGAIWKIETSANTLLVLYKDKSKKAFSLIDRGQFSALPDQEIPNNIIDTIPGGTSHLGLVVQSGANKRLNLLKNNGNALMNDSKIGREMRAAIFFSLSGDLPIGKDINGRTILPKKEAEKFGLTINETGKLAFTPKKAEELGIHNALIDGKRVQRIEVLTEIHPVRGPEMVTTLFLGKKIEVNTR